MSEISNLIKELYKIVDKLQQLNPQKRFTPDGILVGSLGEVYAENYYGLESLKFGTKSYDCKKGDLQIQVKTTQGNSVGISEAYEHLIVLKLEIYGTFKEIYNGEGQRVWDVVKSRDQETPKKGLYTIYLYKLKKLKNEVLENEKLKHI